MEEEGATSILPLMGVDQAILHSIDKCSECPVCVWGGGGWWKRAPQVSCL